MDRSRVQNTRWKEEPAYRVRCLPAPSFLVATAAASFWPTLSIDCVVLTGRHEQHRDVKNICLSFYGDEPRDSRLGAQQWRMCRWLAGNFQEVAVFKWCRVIMLIGRCFRSGKSRGCLPAKT